MIGNYSVIEQIGEGGYSVVYKARHTITGIYVALKCLGKDKPKTPCLAKIEKECRLMQSIDHPFIATYYEFFEDEENYYIAMEYVERGSLLEKINSEEGIDEDTARKVFVQLIFALDYLHNEKKIAHRDIKAENILFDRDNNIRLIDFGLSNSFEAPDTLFQTACGSPNYIAPEVVKRKGYTNLSDVWSAGVVLYAMLIGKLPFYDKNIKKVIEQIVFEEPDYPIHMNPEARLTIQKILIKDPTQRITINELLQEPWLVSFKEYKDYLFIKGTNRFKVMNSQFIDVRVIDMMKLLNINVDTLKDDVTNGNITQTLIAYKMLKRNEVKNDIRQQFKPRTKLVEKEIMLRNAKAYSTQVFKGLNESIKQDVAKSNARSTQMRFTQLREVKKIPESKRKSTQPKLKRPSVKSVRKL